MGGLVRWLVGYGGLLHRLVTRFDPWGQNDKRKELAPISYPLTSKAHSLHKRNV